MRASFYAEQICSDPMKTSLHQVISRITEQSLPASIRKKSFIVNDVGAQFELEADENKVASLLNGVICLVVNNTDNGCIRISAKTIQNAVIISIRENGVSKNKAMAQEIDQLCTLAKRMGSYIGFGENENKIKTIDIRFPNLQTAA